MKRSKGFSVIELLVVVAVIATLAAFSIPKARNAAARGKIFDALAALSAAGGRLDAQCAEENRLPSEAELRSYGPAPLAYGRVRVAGSCADWSVAVEPLETEAELPALCAKKRGMKLQYGARLRGSAFGYGDIPAGNLSSDSGFCAS